MNFSQLHLIGRIGKEPEVKESKNGLSLLTFSIAVNDFVKVGEGWRTDTSWFDCIAFDQSAVALKSRLYSGALVHAVLKPTMRSYTDRQNNLRKTLSNKVIKVTLLEKTNRHEPLPNEDTLLSSIDESEDIPF